MTQSMEEKPAKTVSENNAQSGTQQIAPSSIQGNVQGSTRPKITLSEYRQRRLFLRQLQSVKHYAEHTLAGYDMDIRLAQDQDRYELFLNVTFKLLPDLTEIISDLPDKMVK
jgi:hypothetical protein